MSYLDIYIHASHQVSEVFSPFIQILSLSSSGTTMVCVHPFSVSCRSLSFCLLFFNLVFSVPHTEIGNSIILLSNSMILFPQRIIAQICLESFILVILYISSSEFLFGFFLLFLAPY